MTQHDHPTVVPGCFRCEMGTDEREPMFNTPTTLTDEQIDELGTSHVQAATNGVSFSDCYCCGQRFPCSTIVCLDELVQLRRSLATSERFRMEDGMDKGKLQTFIVALTAELTQLRAVADVAKEVIDLDEFYDGVDPVVGEFARRFRSALADLTPTKEDE